MDDSRVAPSRLRGAVEALTLAEVEQALAIVELAEAHEWTADAVFDVIGTRPVRIGADGTALVDEFLPVEVATLKGISVASATWLIRDVVNLKARHPLLWFQATRGLIPMFRACQLAAEVARFDLTVEQARALDERLAPKVPTLPWRRVLQLARGLITELAAEKVTALQHAARAARFVRKLPTEDPAVAYLSARVDTADAIYFGAMIDRIADILGANGDTDLKEIRRATAVGILATPARAQLMLAEALRPSSSSGNKASSGNMAGSGSHPHMLAELDEAPARPTHRMLAELDEAPRRRAIKWTDPRLLPQATVFVHVAEETLLRGAGPARVEGVGALPATMLKYLLGHSRVRLTPVIRPYAELAVDAYEIPDPIRNQVLQRDLVEVFPFSSRPPREGDLDHTVPYRPGGKRQTRASNLGPLSRKPHRAKTHASWQLEQSTPGVFWWKTPTGERYRVGPNGTIRIGRNPRRRSFEQTLWDSDHETGPPVQRPPVQGVG